MAKRYIMTDVSTKRVKHFEETERKRYYFPGEFRFVGLVYISKLARIKMPADAYRLALLFMENSEYAGISIRSHSFYAETLDVSRPRISQLITLLERTGILRRLGGRSVMVNPTFCWRGTAEEQSTAIARWDSIPQSVRPHLAKRSA